MYPLNWRISVLAWYNIRQMVKNRDLCDKHQLDLPTWAWGKLGTDIFEFNRESIPAIRLLNKMISHTMCNHFTRILAENGLTATIRPLTLPKKTNTLTLQFYRKLHFLRLLEVFFNCNEFKRMSDYRMQRVLQYISGLPPSTSSDIKLILTFFSIFCVLHFPVFIVPLAFRVRSLWNVQRNLSRDLRNTKLPQGQHRISFDQER